MPTCAWFFADGAHHRRSADVDQLDRRIGRERVEVRHHEVERLDPVLVHVGLVLRVRRVGEQAAVDLRVQRDHAVVEDRRDAGELGDVGDRDAGVGDRRRGPAARHERHVELVEGARELHDPGLVVDGQQGPHQRLLLDQVGEHARVEPALDVLDPLVQRLDGVVGQDRHRLLGEDRAVVDVEAGEVHRAAGDLDPGRERVLDRVPALERREQRGMGVDDPVREGVVDRLLEDRAEAGHRDEVDLVAGQLVDHLVGVGDPVEVGAEAGAGHHHRRDAGGLGPAGGGARTVHDHHDDRQTGVQERLEDGSTPRRQDPDPHCPATYPARRPDDPSGSRGPAGVPATVQHSSLPGEDRCSPS